MTEPCRRLPGGLGYFGLVVGRLIGPLRVLGVVTVEIEVVPVRLSTREGAMISWDATRGDRVWGTG